MVAERECLQFQLSELAGIVARAMADNCSYADAACRMGIVQKGGVHGGFYYHRECEAEITTVFEGKAFILQVMIGLYYCNRRIGINYTHSYDTTCDRDKYVTDMASRVIQTMDTSQCGANCSQLPSKVQRPTVRSFHVQCVNDLIVHVQHDAAHHGRNDGGAAHNRDAKPDHNAGGDDDFFRRTRDYGCSSDLDN
ncbi:hypothetical protein AAVH_20677 [Aphelenchoides avenae]|nr:hypothetical protein AAVH_20677 [Aphelenchus avenae]